MLKCKVFLLYSYENSCFETDKVNKKILSNGQKR